MQLDVETNWSNADTAAEPVAPQGRVAPDAAEIAAGPVDVDDVPPRLFVDDYGHSLVVSWSWWQPSGFFLISFAAVWNGVLWGVAFPEAVLSRTFDLGAALMALFFAPFLLVGAALVGICLAMLVNRSRIVVGQGEFVLRSFPLPLFGITVPTDDVAWMFVERKGRIDRATGRRADVGPGEDAQLVQLVLVRRDGTETPVTTSLEDRELAWLVVRLRAFLGLRAPTGRRGA
jgi:hypothetical protein